MIENIMSRNIITLSKNSFLDEASHLMKKYNIGFLPITDEDKIIGVITDRDLALHLNQDITDMMSKSIIHISKNASIENALDKMMKHEIKRLLVTDDKKVVGILSLNDIIAHFDDEKLLVTGLKKIFRQEQNKKEENVDVDTFYL